MITLLGHKFILNKETHICVQDFSEYKNMKNDICPICSLKDFCKTTTILCNSYERKDKTSVHYEKENRTYVYKKYK